MDQDTLLKISEIVAAAMNAENLASIGPDLNAVIPADISLQARSQMLEDAIVYSLAAEQPGYPVDGQPGYLPASADLKACVLNEIDEMIKADFEKREHQATWEQIRKSVAATPENEFEPGIAVNCPDDYLLTLDRLSCAEVLRARNVLPAWA